MRKKTTEQFIKEAELIHEDLYDYKLVNYVNAKTNIDIICRKHGIFKQNPYNHLAGKGCLKCGLELAANSRKKTNKEFIEEANIIHKNLYNYKLTNYIGALTHIKIICKKHGVFIQTPSHHLNGSGCPRCAIEKNSLKQAKTTIKFIEEAIVIHGNLYDYRLVNYINGSSSVNIICKKHGVFKQRANHHLSGSGCPECAGQNKTTESIKKEFKNIHKNRYNYDLVVFKNTKVKLKIICSIHGMFKQSYISHLNGSGCPECAGNIRKTTEEFKTEAEDIHGKSYDYKLVNYKNSSKIVEIKCKTHGVFKQSPEVHLRGSGCPKCSKSISKLEQELAFWIKDNLFMRKIKTNKKFALNGKYKYELDIFIPSLNLGIEFNGLEFHHTHGKSYQGKNRFHKDKYYHRDKSKFFQEEYGIKIIHIWEHEWLKKPEIIKNILKMQLGIKRKRIFARKCEIKKISNKESKLLLESSHLQGSYNSTINYGLFYNEELVSVMGFSKSTQGKDAKWELTRFSNKLGIVVIGGADKLLKHFLLENNNPSLKSFSMNRIFSGKLYEQLGFKLIKVLPPTYFYHKKYEIVLRRQAQKKNIHSFIPDYTYDKNKTEVQTMNENGYFQVFDTGMNYWLRK